MRVTVSRVGQTLMWDKEELRPPLPFDYRGKRRPFRCIHSLLPSTSVFRLSEPTRPTSSCVWSRSPGSGSGSEAFLTGLGCANLLADGAEGSTLLHQCPHRPDINSMQGIESVAAPGALFADELLEGRKRQAQVRGRKAKVETDAVAELILAATHRRHVHEGKRGH